MSVEVPLKTYNYHEILDRRDACKDHVTSFALMYFADRIENEFGDFHFDSLLELSRMGAGEAMLKLWPREHAKTTLISLIYVVWGICYRRSRNIVIFSDTSDQAKEFLRNIKQELENNESIIRDFGDLVGDADRNNGVWNVQHIITANQVQVKAKAAQSQTRGLNASLPQRVYWAGPEYDGEDITTIDDMWIPKDVEGRNWQSRYQLKGGYFMSYRRELVRPDLAILDDILNDKHTKNERIRDEIYKWFWQALWNAIDHKYGRVIVVGTILHEDDLLNRLHNDVEQTEGWAKSRKPACLGFESEVLVEDYIATEGTREGEMVVEAGETRMRPMGVLWPDRWGQINPRTGQYVLWERRRQIGELVFTIEFLLEPIDDAVRIIRRGWIRHYIPNDAMISSSVARGLEQQLGYTLNAMPNDLHVCTAVDPAIGEKDKNDYTVVSTMGYSPSAKKFVLVDITRRRMTAQETVLEIMRQYQKWSMEFGGAARDDRGRIIDRGQAFHHLGVVIEVNAYQKALYESFRMMAKLMGHYPRIIQRHETRDKRYRFMRMQPYFESLDVLFPLDMVKGYELPMVTEAINEIVNIGVAAHDDCPDAIERNLSLLSRFALHSGYGMESGKFIETLLKDDSKEFV